MKNEDIIFIDLTNLFDQNTHNDELFETINEISNNMKIISHKSLSNPNRKEISDYIKSTYTEHYSTTEDGFQVQDMLRHLGIDKDFCQANAIKYLARFGKKNGRNRKDLLKAIHYIILLMSSENK